MKFHDTTIGMDIAKSTFHLARLNRSGQVTDSIKLKRSKVADYFAGIEPCTVAMEACGGAHYWGRRLTGLGHEVVLLPAQKVKPYVQGGKNDRNDAVAVAEARGRPGIRTVAVKSVAQQDLGMQVKLRDQAVRQRTQKRNALRSHLGERGLVTAQGKAALYQLIESVVTPDDNGVLRTDHELTAMFVTMMSVEYQRLVELDIQIKRYDVQIKECAAGSQVIRRLMQVPGFGALTACLFVATVGEGGGFDSARAVAAWLGLTPRQCTTGGKPRLLGITKHGNRKLRTLLIHGARTVLRHAEHKDDPRSRWVLSVAERRGKQKAAVALANKMARIGHAVVCKGEQYDPARI